MEEKITLEQMIEAFSPSLGSEKAISLIKDASLKAGLSIRGTYSNEEALKICEVLETEKKGFIKTIAGFLAAKIILNTKDMRKINELIINLQTAKAKLEEWSRTLEERVEDRTKDLVQAHKAMSNIMQNLERTKTYIENILANFLDTLIVTGIDGTIRTVNHITLDILGYRQEELVGKHIGLISDEEILLNRVLQEGQVKNYEVTYKKKDGNLVHMLFSGSLMRDKEGKSIGIVDIAKDITERKKAEKQQGLLLKDLEDANRIMVGRELKMVELKKEINRLSQELGRPAPYDETSLGG